MNEHFRLQLFYSFHNSDVILGDTKALDSFDLTNEILLTNYVNDRKNIDIPADPQNKKLKKKRHWQLLQKNYKQNHKSKIKKPTLKKQNTF